MKPLAVRTSLLFGRRVEAIASATTLLFVYWFLLGYFRPSLLLSLTNVAGGDTVSHYVLAQYLRDYLLPQGKLVGWYPHWLAGLPIFQFYFIPTYVLTALLGVAIPLEVAFKLISVLGIFLLPLVTLLSCKLMGFRFPAPVVGGVLTLFFLFLENNSYYGGNIPSTLAGEISYSLSLSIMVLSMGLLFRGVGTRKLLALNAILLAIVGLTHVYTSLLMLALIPFFLLWQRRKGFLYVLGVFLLAGLIASFWAIPFLFKVGYASPPSELLRSPNLWLTYISFFNPFYVLAGVSLVTAVKRRDSSVAYIAYATGVSTLLFLLSGSLLPLLHVRFLPFIYYFTLVLAADGIGKIVEVIRTKWIIPLLIFFITGVTINSTVTFIPTWIEWNYEGLQAKPTWSTLSGLFTYLAGLPEQGRIMVEYSSRYDRFGSPRVFEVSPAFTGKSVMEGLLLESSLTFPFYYFLQREVSESSWWPGFPLQIPSFDLDQGANDLRLYNVRYYVASSNTVKKAISDHPQFQLLAEIEDFRIYRLNFTSSYVEPLEREPVLVVTDDWRKFAFTWMSLGRRDVPLAFANNLDTYDSANFKLFVLDKHVPALPNKREAKVFNSTQLKEAVEASQTIKSGCHATEVIVEERIAIRTNCIGSPLLVKTTFFPNWQATGAKKIYLASPSLMLIFPESEDVTLVYRDLPVDEVGKVMSVFGVMIVALSSARRFRELSASIKTRYLGVSSRTPNTQAEKLQH